MEHIESLISSKSEKVNSDILRSRALVELVSAVSDIRDVIAEIEPKLKHVDDLIESLKTVLKEDNGRIEG